jgi:hypothetical protein
MTFTIERDTGLTYFCSLLCRHLACMPAEPVWRAASAMAQRLWLTTSTLCPSGSSTNAP